MVSPSYLSLQTCKLQILQSTDLQGLLIAMQPWQFHPLNPVIPFQMLHSLLGKALATFESQTKERHKQDLYEVRQIGEVKWGKIDWAASEKDFDAEKVTVNGRYPGIFNGLTRREFMKGEAVAVEVHKKAKSERRLLVRQCYEELAEIMLDHFQHKGRVFVLNGNPGIGKSLFSFYFMWRLAQMGGQAIVWERKSAERDRYLISPVGMFGGSMKDFSDVLANKDTWYLVDGKPPKHPNAKIVLFCSPNHEITKVCSLK